MGTSRKLQANFLPSNYIDVDAAATIWIEYEIMAD